jgi:hypothetical protein
MVSTDQAEVSAPVSSESPAAIVAASDSKSTLWDWLERAGRRAGLPSLVIGFVALCVSSASLYVVIANYRLTLAGNRPELASNGFQIDLVSRPPHVVVNLENIGKKMGRRGTARLFSLADPNGTTVEFGRAAIIGAGTSIFPGYGSSARFDSSSLTASPLFLVCADYFDDNGSIYHQAFLFERSPITARDPAELAYAELAAPDLSRCTTR